MVGLNKIMIIGHLGTDPEMRYTPNGNAVTSFRIASTRMYTKPDGERQQDTEWFTVVAWNQLGERCNQFLAKGRRAFIEGRLQSRTWSGQDGQSRFTNEIVANHVMFLDRQGTAVEGEEEQVRPASPETTGIIEPDDLPF
jgi:single-strand DNA-binding protein